ncbi:MAG TPA: hypothetical protein VJH03_00980 [Blastocatellia bacterium]|nr:hypothetical protein [Blastocatellia bacterium]
MANWDKEELKLDPKHTWRAGPGHRIFVADSGAVRIEFPQDWVVIPGDDSIKFHDKQPPDDDTCLAVSYIRLPPIDWSGLPLSELLEVAMKDDTRPIYSRGETHVVKRPDLELAWAELAFIDPAENRDARSRICIARGSNIQPLITMEFWEDQRARFAPVWDEVLESLQLGVYVDDPTRGPTIQ